MAISFKNNHSQIKLAAVLSYASIVFNIGAGLLYTPWMVKQIGISDYGLFALVTSFLTYFIMDFGLGEAIARFISKYRVLNDERKINQILGITSKIYLKINLLILVALVIMYFVIEHIFVELSAAELVKFKTIYLIAGFFSLISFPFTPLNGIIIAYERFVLLKICDVISKIGTIIFTVLALYLGYKLYALVAINAGMGILVILVKLFYLNKATNINIDFSYKSKTITKEIFSFSIWVTIIGVAQRLLLNIVPTLLAVFSGTVAIAIFSIGNIIEGYVWTFASALNGLFLPKVTKLASGTKDRKEIENLMVRVGRIQLTVVGILFIGLLSLGKEFIVLWMGEQFITSYYVIILLVLPGIITLTQNIAATLVYVENKVKYTALIQISCSVVSILISILLIPHYGAIGAAIGIFISLILFQVIGMNLMYHKILKINIVFFFKECFLKLMPALGITLLFSVTIQYYFPAANFLVFFVKVGLIGFVYVVVMWILGFNTYEKELFRSFAVKILPRKK